MEPIKAQPKTRISLLSFKDGSEMYAYCEKYVQEHRREDFTSFWEVVEKASITPIDEHHFVREHMWCVYVAGFSATRIAAKFPALLIEHNIEDKDGNYIPIHPENIITDFTKLYQVFANKNKANAVQRLRRQIYTRNWDRFYQECVADRNPNKLHGLPGIGPTLSFHLARNLGNKQVVKPDIHLQRLADRYGYASPQKMCETISKEPPGKTDLILWLASVDNGTLPS